MMLMLVKMKISINYKFLFFIIFACLSIRCVNSYASDCVSENVKTFEMNEMRINSEIELKNALDSITEKDISKAYNEMKNIKLEKVEEDKIEYSLKLNIKNKINDVISYLILFLKENFVYLFIITILLIILFVIKMKGGKNGKNRTKGTRKI